MSILFNYVVEKHNWIVSLIEGLSYFCGLLVILEICQMKYT